MDEKLGGKNRKIRKYERINSKTSYHMALLGTLKCKNGFRLSNTGKILNVNKIWFETQNFRRDETSFTDLKFIDLPKKKTKQTKTKHVYIFISFC